MVVYGIFILITHFRLKNITDAMALAEILLSYATGRLMIGLVLASL